MGTEGRVGWVGWVEGRGGSEGGVGGGGGGSEGGGVGGGNEGGGVGGGNEGVGAGGVGGGGIEEGRRGELGTTAGRVGILTVIGELLDIDILVAVSSRDSLLRELVLLQQESHSR